MPPASSKITAGRVGCQVSSLYLLVFGEAGFELASGVELGTDLVHGLRGTTQRVVGVG